MATIAKVTSDYFRIPLPVPLSDSTHGFMPDFELVTVRIRYADGADGVGYTYTAGRNGRSVHAAAREIAEFADGKDADLADQDEESATSGQLHSPPPGCCDSKGSDAGRAQTGSVSQGVPRNPRMDVKKMIESIKSSS